MENELDNPWKTVYRSSHDETYYMEVDGGRIYRSVRIAFNEGESDSVALVFVPGVKH